MHVNGAEICELEHLIISNNLGNAFGKKNIELYRDDGLEIIKNRPARLANKARKELFKVFEQFSLKITGEANFSCGKFSRGHFN